MVCRFSLVIAIAAAAPALAQDYVAFQAPSGNIGCAILDDQLRCDILDYTPTYQQPADCDLDFGFAFVLDASGPGYPICAGDTVMDSGASVVGYGEVFEYGSFSCTSDEAGLTCYNLDGGGIFLSRAVQDAF